MDWSTTVLVIFLTIFGSVAIILAVAFRKVSKLIGRIVTWFFKPFLGR